LDTRSKQQRQNSKASRPASCKVNFTQQKIPKTWNQQSTYVKQNWIPEVNNRGRTDKQAGLHPAR